MKLLGVTSHVLNYSREPNSVRVPGMPLNSSSELIGERSRQLSF